MKSTILMAGILAIAFFAGQADARIRNPWILVDHDLNTWSAGKSTTTHDNCPSFPVYNPADPSAFFKALHDSVCAGEHRCDIYVYSDWGGICTYARKNDYIFHGPTTYQEFPKGQRGRLMDIFDPMKYFNVFGYGYCGPVAGNMYNYYTLLGYQAQRWQLSNSAHLVCEVNYNDGWHYFDWDEGGWAADASGNVYGLAYATTHGSTWDQSPIKSAYFWSYGSDLAFIKGALASGNCSITPAPANGGGADMSFCLRIGEKMERFYEPLNASYTHPHANTPFFTPAVFGNSRLTYAPTLRSGYADYLDGIYDESNATLESDGVHLTNGYVIWAVRSPYPIYSTNATVTGTGTLLKEVHFNAGNNLYSKWELYDTLTIQENYDYLLRVSGTGVISGLNIVTIGQLRPGALPTLRPGNNNVRFNLYDNDETLTMTYVWPSHKASSADAVAASLLDNGKAIPVSVSGYCIGADRPISFERQKVADGSFSRKIAMAAEHDASFLYTHYHTCHLTQDYLNDLIVKHVFNISGGGRDSVTRTFTAEDIAGNAGVIDYTVNAGSALVQDPNYAITMEVAGGVLLTDLQNHPTYSDVSAEKGNTSALTAGLVIGPNEPNPFGRSTTINFTIGGLGAKPVTAAVYNAKGELIRVLERGAFSPGAYRTIWDGVNSRGIAVPCGVYYVRLSTPIQSATRKIVMLR
ncbi:MAG: hypothetical protein A2268_13765 [Candidatus Raymondbacteria bacterium RifOxyA12_full_50_37]|uniref:FlgD/Vpr Ig-like domain-containing protein n=1 Tax=Candidatus Raymondbacteria bacterium RIFOXYD12_FULL_49_13 TaxID=1817890 RepID=A0A1F7FLG6_UNCRA|nr:MAG: hypothetical protein A2248_08080 [Candidatus Raymondbacteria bacterium RIFOXYA2_FULL_49_16]OGJ87198.1 MAG: hypothetical protein A2350_04330 [Candidatus Raymondbacteria bacterium RifOxyB12_full_50_8]OGJ91676.1 MAG: hypothetical protein A2268_13765 [Candidatus Raymondbacteria bacterium RifOxyA12_full_50_37]OGJ95213.1 MAG: hypothetical protein A2453_12090 [Candidatus Raymondbacteria bacterium RIFOXYC2_FULL_50_21]OGK07564.1 MAG: hypothetical protein A2519_01560 [Candidatus Raymondbacteria b